MFRIGVNFDVDYITAGLVDENYNIVKKEYKPTLRYRGFEAIVKDIAMLCIKLCKSMDLDINKDIEYVGIGCLGSVDTEKGIMIHTSWFEGFEDAPIVSEIKKHINTEIYIERNANCYALAESKIGATKDYKNSVVVVLGSGISGGIILDGKIYHGAFYGAGEFGHHVIIHDGEECACGRKGCWVAYASSAAMVRDARIMAIKHPECSMFKIVNGDLRLMSVDTIYKASEMGDNFAKKVIDDYVGYLALGLINIINILQPDVVAIGGKPVISGEKYLDKIREFVNVKTFGQIDKDKKTKILRTSLGYDSVIIGAAMLKE